MTLPFVSIVVPTANRRRFIPMLLHYFEYQTYPAKKMEMIVYDDGAEKVKDLFITKKRVRYIETPPRVDRRLTIAQMRNRLNDQAQGDVIVCMDDDDYYPPERVAHAVEMLQMSGLQLAGCSRIPIYISDEGFFINGYRHPRHSCACAMAYTRDYLKTHSFDKDKRVAEEGSFTKNFTEPMVQLDPKLTAVAINHGTNTFDKKKMIGPCTMRFDTPLEKVFKDPEALKFYKEMRVQK